MRISVDPEDRGYLPKGMRRFVSTLNGKLMPHAITADEELGLMYVMQENGPPLLLQGVVKIETIN